MQLNNPLKLSNELINLLLKDFQRFELDDSSTDFAQRILAFVVDGSDEEVVEELSTAINAAVASFQTQQAQLMQQIQGAISLGQLPQLNQFQEYADRWVQSAEARSQFWQKINIQDAPLFWRLTQVYKVSGNPNPYMGFQAVTPDWLHVFLHAIASDEGNYYSNRDNLKLKVSAKTVEQMLNLADENPDQIARLAYLGDPDDYQARRLAQICNSLNDFSEYSLKYPTIIYEALFHTAKQKAATLEIIRDRQVDPTPFIEAIATLAVSSTKSVREQAELIIHKHLELAMPTLEYLAVKGKADERLYAVKLLGTRESYHPFLQERLQVEKTEKVKDAIAKILETPTIIASVEPAIALPPLPEVTLEAPLPESAKTALQKFTDQLYRIAEDYKKTYQKWAEIPDPSSFQDCLDNLQQGLGKDCINFIKDIANWKDSKLINQFVENPDLELIHVVRFLLMIGEINFNNKGNYMSYAYYRTAFNRSSIEYLLRYQNPSGKIFGLRELEAVFQVLEIDTDSIGFSFLDPYSGKALMTRLKWEDELIYPYFQERLHILEEILKPQPTSKSVYHYGRNAQRLMVFTILEKFPQPPVKLQPILWEIALGNSKTERPMAQRCLETLPDLPEKVIKALSDRSADIRIAAADWLGRYTIPNAIAIIKNILKSEKSEVVKDALIRSLEKLGASVDEFLNRDGLAIEANAGLKKGIPDGLAWFPFDQMPAVVWEDTNELVNPEIITWFMIQAHKQKTPEPSPLVNRYFSYLKKSQREELGKFILQAWIGQDTIPKYTYSEADILAKPQTAATWSYNQQFLSQTPDNQEDIYQKALQVYQSHQHYTPEQTEEYARSHANSIWQKRLEAEALTEGKLHQTHINQFLSQLKGSAIKEKGIIAIAGACGGTAIIPLVSNYLQTYYGKRGAQCIALLQMLSWVDDFNAIQLLLSVAKRFRTKSIQDEAQKCVDRLAERKGWTIDELSDRTIPTLGFENQSLGLDYGTRMFNAKLDQDFSFVLYNPDGKIIKSLPEPRKDEDPEVVKETKKLLSDAKKQLKSLLTLQKERLYEAMCTQRSWVFRDWDAFLNQHPIICRYVGTLVWAVFTDKTITQTFRPLEDGSLTDVEDNAVAIAPESMIRLAHASLLDPELCAAWQAHLGDYEVMPLFPQFGQDTYILSEEKAQETELSDFKGYMIETFQIRGKATKLGYVRGQSEDGGWFYDYRKSFTGLKLEAVIRFTGNYLPEENRPAALEKLAFYPIEEDSDYNYNRQPMPLSAVPSVLLSETWHDLKAIAAQGTGYDPDWQKKSAY